jgi:DNA helicase-2/ATP-dependent DNA helicase PcrA
LTDPIVADELRLLARVNALLAKLPASRAPAESSIVSELERLRELLLSRGQSSDAVALREQWHRHTALLEQIRSSNRAPQVDPRSPYFAHLRLREDGEERDLCLGRATCVEDDVRIVDWRNAPVSRIFYRYQQGETYEEEFAGKPHAGEVAVRRTVLIRDGALERVEAPEGIFAVEAGAPNDWRRLERTASRLAGGEASAFRAHGTDEGAGRRLGTDLLGSRRRGDKRLPEITGLIDPDQFDLITRPAAGFLAIRGTAGSGKTTVALHRIAYLAYQERAIDSAKTLFVTFSPALRNYVGHVLPALGVDRVGILTYREWAARQRRRHFPRLPPEIRPDTPAVVQRLKLHPALGVALAEQVWEVAGRATAEQALDDWASALTRPARLEEILSREAPGAFTSEEIGRCADWSRVRNEELFAYLEGDEQVQAELDAEDETLLLRAWQLRVGPLRYRGRSPLRYRHLALDEVQDFSPLEVQVMLECLDHHRSLTLAGDTQQHLMEDSGFTSWSEFLTHLGVSGTEIETLRISYRSSREIMEFALSLLGDLREEGDEPVATRSGPPVEVFRFSDRGACVAFLADALRELAREEPLASVAVLTPSAELSAIYHQGLGHSDLPRLRLVESQNFTFAPGVEVTEVEQVKGLEFDYVVLVEVGIDDYPDTPGARRHLHVGATRAVHQLWLTTVGTPSPLVAPWISGSD